MTQTVVVTGVSSGIGEGITTVLIRAGWRVFGSVRNESDAATACDKFGSNFEPLIFDVTDEVAVTAAAETVREKLGGATLSALVNNAGVAFSDPLLVQDTRAFRQQVEINLVGPFIVTKAFAPLLGANEQFQPHPGRIVNISSVGGKMAGPFIGAYVASKHAIEGYSTSLRRELQIFGVDVIVVGPGSVATPIWDKAEVNVPKHLAGTVWEKPVRAFTEYMISEGRKGYHPEVIGDVVLKALTSAKPKVRYAPVPGKLINWTIPMTLPARVVDRLIAGQIGLNKR